MFWGQKPLTHRLLLWINFWSMDFLGYKWRSSGFFWVLIFAPIQSSPSLGIRSTPPPPPPPSGCNVDTIYITIHQVSHSGYSSHADIRHQQQLPVTCPLLMLLILLRRNAWAPHVSRLTLQGEVILLQRAKLVLPILLVNNHWVDLPGKDGSPPDCRLVGLRCYELWTMKYDSVTS